VYERGEYEEKSFWPESGFGQPESPSDRYDKWSPTYTSIAAQVRAQFSLTGQIKSMKSGETLLFLAEKRKSIEATARKLKVPIKIINLPASTRYPEIAVRRLAKAPKRKPTLVERLRAMAPGDSFTTSLKKGKSIRALVWNYRDIRIQVRSTGKLATVTRTA